MACPPLLIPKREKQRILTKSFEVFCDGKMARLHLLIPEREQRPVLTKILIKKIHGSFRQFRELLSFRK